MDPVLLSVIIPVYNCERYVEQAIRSVIEQPGKGIEAVVVDDGSTDGSVSIMNSYGRDPKIHVIHTANKGVCCARNTGVEHASGRYVCFLDHDDVLARNAYTEEVADLLREGAADVISFYGIIANERIRRGRIRKRAPGMYKRADDDAFVQHMQCSHQSSIFKKEMLVDGVCFPPGATYREDVVFVGLINEVAKSAIVLDHPWYVWRNHLSSVSHNREKYHNQTLDYRIRAYAYGMMHAKSDEKRKSSAQSVLMASCKYLSMAVAYGTPVEEALSRIDEDARIREARSLGASEEQLSDSFREGLRLARTAPKVFARFCRKQERKKQLLRRIAHLWPVHKLNQRFRLGFKEDLRDYRFDWE